MFYQIEFTRDFSDNIPTDGRLFWIEHTMELSIDNVPPEKLSEVVKGLMENDYTITSIVKSASEY